MEKKTFTFEQLPEAVGLLHEKVDDLKQLVAALMAPDHSPQERFLGIEGAAEFLHLAVPTVYDKVQKREIPFYKQSKRLYFLERDLQAYLESGRRRTNAEISAEADTYISRKNNRR